MDFPHPIKPLEFLSKNFNIILLILWEFHKSIQWTLSIFTLFMIHACMHTCVHTRARAHTPPHVICTCVGVVIVKPHSWKKNLTLFPSVHQPHLLSYRLGLPRQPLPCWNVDGLELTWPKPHVLLWAVPATVGSWVQWPCHVQMGPFGSSPLWASTLFYSQFLDVPYLSS